MGHVAVTAVLHGFTGHWGGDHTEHEIFYLKGPLKDTGWKSDRG